MRISDWGSDVCSSDLLFEPMACARVMGIDQSLALRCLRPDMAFCGDLLRAAALIDEPLRALRGPGARMIARGGVVEARRVAPEIPVLTTRKACRGGAAALTRLERSEESRVGTEGGRSCRFGWVPYH